MKAIPPVTCDGGRISSTAIRRAVAAGDLETVERLQVRPFSLFGRVISGDQLGRKLGFPTANLEIQSEALLPYGVYVVRALSHNNRPGVANLGVRPSLEGVPTLRFEVHLLDWTGDLYGEKMEVALLHQLRPERRFAQLTDLQQQIGVDLENAREWLKNAANGV